MIEITVDETLSALNQLAAAMERCDASALERIYSDDYLLVTNYGTLDSKTVRVDAIRTGAIKYHEVGFSNPNVRTFGKTAVVIANTHGKGESMGQPFVFDMITTIVFVKTSEGIREVSAQITNRA